jgi:hypothetical protein
MPECSGRARPFLQSWLRRIAPDTHVDQASGGATGAFRPGGDAAPEERWYRNASRGFVQIRGCRHPGANPSVARIAGGPRNCPSGTAARHPIQVPGAVAQSSHGACRSPSKVLREAACHIKRFVLLQNMEAGSRQFVRERLACDDRVRPGFLALIKTLGLGAIALGEVGRFHEGP